jgi:signal transduction histidine kinase
MVGAMSDAPSGAALRVVRAAAKALAQVLVGVDRPSRRRPGKPRVVAGVVNLVVLVVVVAAARTYLDHAVTYRVIAKLGGIEVSGYTASTATVAVLWAAYGGLLLIAVRYSLLAWRIALGFVLLVPPIPVPTNTEAFQYLVVVVLFAVAGWRMGRASLWWMGVLTVLPVWVWRSPGPLAGVSWIQSLVGTVAVIAVAFALDAALRAQRVQRDLVDQYRRTRDEESRRAVLEERTRIARELHDVVAHHLSLIAVQSETARYRRPGLSVEAVEEFDAIGAHSREALSDMRSALGVLRMGAESERVPQPGLADIPRLVEASRVAGVDVALTMPGAVPVVSPGVALTAYRIVQQALTNAGEHSAGSRVTVVVDEGPAGLRLAIRNPMSGGLGPAEVEGGHGLRGMRERVALHGGTMVAGATEDNEFIVSVELPPVGAGWVGR